MQDKVHETYLCQRNRITLLCVGRRLSYDRSDILRLQDKEGDENELSQRKYLITLLKRNHNQGVNETQK